MRGSQKSGMTNEFKSGKTLWLTTHVRVRCLVLNMSCRFLFVLSLYLAGLCFPDVVISEEQEVASDLTGDDCSPENEHLCLPEQLEILAQAKSLSREELKAFIDEKQAEIDTASKFALPLL